MTTVGEMIARKRDLLECGPLRVEEIKAYQGDADLVGACIVNDSFMVAEISGAIRVWGVDHRLHVDFAHCLAAAPELQRDLRRVVEHLEAWARDHAGEATTETWAALHCARETLRKSEAAS